jgi:hypothetical protein
MQGPFAQSIERTSSSAERAVIYRLIRSPRYVRHFASMPTVLLLCVSLLVAHGALASAQVAGELPRLPEAVITGECLPRLEEASSQFLITPEDIRLQPPARSANILRQVPGFVTIDHFHHPRAPPGSGGLQRAILRRVW